MGRFWPNRLLFWNVLLTSFFFSFCVGGFSSSNPNGQRAYHQHYCSFAGKRGLTWKIFFICKKTKKTKQKKEVSFGWKAKYIWSFWKEMLLKGFFVELLPFIFFSAGGVSPQRPASNILLHKDALESPEIFTFSSVSEFPASRAHGFLGADCLWICVFFWCGAAAFLEQTSPLLVFGRPVAEIHPLGSVFVKVAYFRLHLKPKITHRGEKFLSVFIGSEPRLF